jgi:hypothetical protein
MDLTTPSVVPGNRIGDFAALPVDLDKGPKVHHLPGWKHRDDPTRIAALRKVVQESGKDPRLATISVEIIRASGAEPRDYQKQAAALLSWVQSQIYYITEPGERLQDPIYTLRVRYGDCDDMAMLLAAMYESIRLPWRFVLSGRQGKKTVRWIEGTKKKSATWSHIYVIVGWPPYTPKKWKYAEPTLRGVPLGWDVVGSYEANGKVVLPELAGPEGVSDAGERAPLMVRVREDIPGFVEHVKKEVKSKLHPRNLVPAVFVGLVIGLISEVARRSIAGAIKKKRRRK